MLTAVTKYDQDPYRKELLYQENNLWEMFYEEQREGKNPELKACHDMIWSTREELYKRLNKVQQVWTDRLNPQKLMQWEEDAHAKRGICTFLTAQEIMASRKIKEQHIKEALKCFHEAAEDQDEIAKACEGKEERERRIRQDKITKEPMESKRKDREERENNEKRAREEEE